MKWLKNLIKKIFSKNKTPYLAQAKNVIKQNSKNDFIFDLKSSLDLERDDGNGYRIKPNYKLKDLI